MNESERIERALYVMTYGDVEQCVLDNLPAGHGGCHARIGWSRNERQRMASILGIHWEASGL